MVDMIQNLLSDCFICQICSRVLHDPHLAVCCGQHFCESCLKRWFKKQAKKSYPHCRTQGSTFNYVIHKGVKSELSQLRVKCANHGEGCEWSGELGDLESHLKYDYGCDYIIVPCPIKCKKHTASFHSYSMVCTLKCKNLMNISIVSIIFRNTNMNIVVTRVLMRQLWDKMVVVVIKPKLMS